MEGRTIRRVIAATVFATGCLSTAAAAIIQQTGQYALSTGKARIESRLTLSLGAGGHDMLTLIQYPLRSNRPITKYVQTEQDPLHVIILRDDFQSFGHVHPRLSSGGAFRLPVTLQNGHRYYTYVASRPAGLSEQVFRFVLAAGRPPQHQNATIRAPITKVMAGPYQISLDQSQLRANRPQLLTADINRSDRAAGITPYHVVWVHGTLINAATLAYAEFGGAFDKGICCEYAMHLPALAPGLYRLWLQFYDGETIYTAPLTFGAR